MLVIHWSAVKNTKKILKNGITKSKNGLYCFPLTGNKKLDHWWVTAFNQHGYRKHRTQYNGFIFKIEKEDMPACFGHAYGHTTKDTFKMEITELKELELHYQKRIFHKIGEKLVKNKYCESEEFKKIIDIVDKMNEERTIHHSDLLKYPFLFYLLTIEDPIEGISSYSSKIRCSVYELKSSDYSTFRENSKISVDPQLLLNNSFSNWLESKSIYEYDDLIDLFIETAKIEIKENINKYSENYSELLNNAFHDWQIILSRSISPDRIKKIVSSKDEFGKIIHSNKKYKDNKDYNNDMDI